MKPKMLKRIIGVLVLFFALNCIIGVRAQEDTISDADWIEMFGVNIDVTEDNPPITMLYFNPENPETNCQYTFKITKINDKTDFDPTTVPATIGCGSNNQESVYPLNISPSADGHNDLSYGVSITLESLVPITLGGKDYNVEMTISYSEDGADDGEQDGYFDPGNPGTFEPGTPIDCDKTYAAGTFNYQFCRVKKAYLSSHNNKPISITDGVYSGSPKEFACSMNPDDIDTNWESLTGDAYFVNHGYLYGESTTTVSDQYTFHYAPGGSAEGTNIGYKKVSCTVKCEEAVEVEYGPPVASRAGLCFEYKVRVTSRVSCHATGNVEKPPHNTKYCTPRPVCVTSSGNELYQAGPNEEYDQCVKECDGGKYTKKCSNRCYVEIYGSIAAGARANSSTDINNTNATLLSSHPTCPSCTNGLWADELWNNNNSSVDYSKCRGYYAILPEYYYPIWKNFGANGVYTAGRWYCEHYSTWNPLSAKNNYYTARNDGFFRKILNTQQPCNDKCHWRKLKSTSCSSKYINKYVPCKIAGQYDYTADSIGQSLCGKNGAPTDYLNILEYDYLKNLEVYNSLINRCNARAVCNETTSYYTISAKYGEKGVTNITQVDFPGSGLGDFARATKEGSENSAGNKQTTLFINYPTENTGLSGCYNRPNTLHTSETNPAHITDLYRTTWGFPGTWINIKTGEVSYTGNGVSTESGWRLYDDKFCLPLNAADVNTEWYDAYRYKYITNNVTSLDNYEIYDKCFRGSFYQDGIIDFPVNSVDYNIIAQATDFGYFNWDIDIKCFYALHSRPFTSEEPHNDEEEKICDPTIPEPYRVHASDPIDLFPSPEGEKTTSTSSSGRTPGFNWSQYAVNYKNPDYISDPPKLMKEIQTIAKAGNTYSDDYLDYQFYITPQNIRKLRSSKTHPFDDSGYGVSENGVVHYQSSMIRNSEYFSNITVPQGSSVNCNNIDKKSGGCLKLK